MNKGWNHQLKDSKCVECVSIQKMKNFAVWGRLCYLIFLHAHASRSVTYNSTPGGFGESLMLWKVTFLDVVIILYIQLQKKHFIDIADAYFLM